MFMSFYDALAMALYGVTLCYYNHCTCTDTYVKCNDLPTGFGDRLCTELGKRFTSELEYKYIPLNNTTVRVVPNSAYRCSSSSSSLSPPPPFLR